MCKEVGGAPYINIQNCETFMEGIPQVKNMPASTRVRTLSMA